MRTPLPGLRTRLKSSVAVAAGLVAVTGLVTYAGTAGAAPQPSITQVESKVNQLTSQFDQANQQYDQAAQQVSQARVKLSAANKQVAAAQVQFKKLQGAVAEIAATSYENSNMTSIAGLLSSNDPNAVLNSASLLMEISQGRNQQLSAFLVAAQQLKTTQQQAQRTKDALAVVEKQKLDQKQKASKALSGEKSVYANLTSEQQATVQAKTVGGSGGTTTPTTAPPPRSTPRPTVARRPRSPCRSSAARTSTVPPAPATTATTVLAWPRPPGPPLGCPSRAPPTTTGPRCRTSRCRRWNRVT